MSSGISGLKRPFWRQNSWLTSDIGNVVAGKPREPEGLQEVVERFCHVQSLEPAIHILHVVSPSDILGLEHQVGHYGYQREGGIDFPLKFCPVLEDRGRVDVGEQGQEVVQEVDVLEGGVVDSGEELFHETGPVAGDDQLELVQDLQLTVGVVLKWTRVRADGFNAFQISYLCGIIMGDKPTFTPPPKTVE